jgi:hypothetical protein
LFLCVQSRLFLFGKRSLFIDRQERLFLTKRGWCFFKGLSQKTGFVSFIDTKESRKFHLPILFWKDLLSSIPMRFSTSKF